MAEGSGRRALVTGASSGIGLAFAHLLAAHGYEMVLVARRTDRLEAAARDLTAQYGVLVHVHTLDLSEPQAVERLTRWLVERDLAIDLLVNNAGFGVPGRYAATMWADQERFLQVLVVAVCELTHRLLPGMIERRWGRIITVASLAGLMPAVAGHTLYAAAKAFAVSFSEALALETRADGIQVTASCPGFTLSEFHDVTGTRAHVSKLPRFLWLDAAVVARYSYDAVMAGTVIAVPGRINRAMAALSRLLPRRVVRALMQRNAGKFRKV